MKGNDLLGALADELFHAEGAEHWLLNGSRTTANNELWVRLDWSKAWLDMGPSVAGNPGPTGTCRCARAAIACRGHLGRAPSIGSTRAVAWRPGRGACGSRSCSGPPKR